MRQPCDAKDPKAEPLPLRAIALTRATRQLLSGDPPWPTTAPSNTPPPTGNDYPAHEASYERFVHFTFVGIIYVINILFGLAVGGVMGHWFLALPVFIIAIVGAVPGTGRAARRTSSYVAFVLCFLIFAYAGCPLTSISCAGAEANADCGRA